MSTTFSMLRGGRNETRDRLDPRDPDERQQIAELRRLADAKVESEFHERPFRMNETEDRADAVSFAWEIATSRHGIKWPLAMWFAWKDVRTYGRRDLFKQTSRSFTGERATRGKAQRGQRVEFNLKRFPDRQESPADRATRRADLMRWMRCLTPRQQEVLNLALQGFDQVEIGHKLGWSNQTISNEAIRIRASYRKFFGDDSAN